MRVGERDRERDGREEGGDMRRELREKDREGMLFIASCGGEAFSADWPLCCLFLSLPLSLSPSASLHVWMQASDRANLQLW